MPAKPRPGESVTIPKRIVLRIARFHLLDNTRGEPPHWSREDVRKADLKLVVEAVTDSTVTLRLEGVVLLATAADPAQADRGFDARLLGYLRYNIGKKALERFDLVAVGEHWGQGPFTRGARPGRSPFGVAFELARGDSPANQVPPQGSRFLRGYWNADKD